MAVAGGRILAVGAYLTHDEEVRGSLEAGKLADFIVVEGDPERSKKAAFHRKLTTSGAAHR